MTVLCPICRLAPAKPKYCSVACSRRRQKHSKLCACGCEQRVSRSSSKYVRGHFTDEVRFWSKVNKNDPNGCWVWTSSNTGDKPGYGHGRFSVGGQLIMATHFLWKVILGMTIPDGLFVLHRCNNPPCVNPDHLFLGTLSVNAQQMWDDGRGPGIRGEKCGQAKLTEAQALGIISLRHSGRTGVSVAEEFKVCPSTVSHIWNGRSWKHIPREEIRDAVDDIETL